MLKNIKIQTAKKSDKKIIKKFYKHQHYSASFMGLDTVYFIKHQDIVIASVIISQLQAHNSQHLLHALVVDEQYRNQGLASQLLNYSVLTGHQIICFAAQEMHDFYLNAGYKQSSSKQLNELNLTRYQQYKKYKQNLQVFIKQL